MHKHIRWLALVALISSLVALPGTGWTQATTNPRWIGSWAASPLRPDPVGVTDPAVQSRTGFEDQTLREIIYPHAGGSMIRVRLANTFGDAPLLIGQASIGVQAEGASIASGTDRPLTFGGRAAVTIPAGAQVYSDPTALQFDAGRTLAISLYLPGPTGPITWHATARQTLYVASGNVVPDVAGSAFEGWTNIPAWFVITGLEVAATSADQAAIVTFGDSITDGTASTQDANHRWPNFLARRLWDRGSKLSVLDEGIAGNRVLTDTPTHVNALARLDRDVLSQNGVKYVVLLEAINDIGQTCLGNANASAEELIAGYQQIITQVHLKGLKIFGATLTPFRGTGETTPPPRYYCDEGETKRGIVNTWIRTSGQFDGVIDFDKVTRDESGDPLRFNPAFDSGDHLHPNDAGYEAMANAIDLALFAP